jgi:hypothetical protein
MRRKLFTLAAGLSAVLCVAVVVLWARSDTRHDALIVRLTGYRAAWVESVRDGVQFGTMTNTPPERFSTGWSSVEEPGSPFPLRTRAGFGAVSIQFDIAEPDGVHTRPVTVRAAVVPPYALLLATAILPAWWCLARRQRGSELGTCAECGRAYDLRAAPDRCPECGTPAPAEDADV